MATVTEESTGTRTSKSLRTIGVVVAVLITSGAIVVLLLLGSGDPGGRQPATVTVGEQEANSNVRLRVGDTFVVTLEGNPTTGFTWEVASSDPAILKPLGEAQFTPDTSALGSGGKVSLQFEAIGTGQTPLKLIYHRPFEVGAAPLKTYDLTVSVEK